MVKNSNEFLLLNQSLLKINKIPKRKRNGNFLVDQKKTNLFLKLEMLLLDHFNMKVTLVLMKILVAFKLLVFLLNYELSWRN